MRPTPEQELPFLQAAEGLAKSAISSPVVLAAPIVLPSPMVGNAIDCDCFRRGKSGRADSLNCEAIASETEVFLAAPIGGAGRELIALARTSLTRR